VSIIDELLTSLPLTYFLFTKTEEADQALVEGDEERADEELPTEPPAELLEQQEAELLSKLTPEQVEQVIEEVCTEMLGSLEVSPLLRNILLMNYSTIESSTKQCDSLPHKK